MGRAVELRPGREGAREGPPLRPQLLDDRLGEPCHAQVHLEARLVGAQAQGEVSVH